MLVRNLEKLLSLHLGNFSILLPIILRVDVCSLFKPNRVDERLLGLLLSHSIVWVGRRLFATRKLLVGVEKMVDEG